MMENSIQASRKYELDCQCLNSCFTGNVALQQKIVELITSRNLQEIKLIRQIFSALYHKDIVHFLSNIRRNDPFANVVYLKINEPQDRDAELIRDSLFAWSKVNLNLLIEVVCTRSSTELCSIKQAYSTRYGANVEQDIAQKISGNFEGIILAVLKSSNKFQNRIDMSMAMCDAKTLYEAVESGNSVDWKTIISILGERNRVQIRAIFNSYKELYGHEFSKFLKCSKCGNFGKDLRFVIRGIQYPEKFFSKQLRGAMQRGDTKEAIVRIIVTRLEDDIKDINNVLAAKTGWSLGSLVRKEFKAAGNQKNSANDSYFFVGEVLLGLFKCR